jgi:hypothetical protein
MIHAAISRVAIDVGVACIPAKAELAHVGRHTIRVVDAGRPGAALAGVTPAFDARLVHAGFSGGAIDGRQAFRDAQPGAADLRLRTLRGVAARLPGDGDAAVSARLDRKLAAVELRTIGAGARHAELTDDAIAVRGAPVTALTIDAA